MHKNANELMCKNNLKQIVSMAHYYIDDNNDFYPSPGNKAKYKYRSSPLDENETFRYTWDDLLSIYDGRDLSHDEMRENGLYSNSTLVPNSKANVTKGNGAFSFYICPEDLIKRRDESTSGVKDKRMGRTYTMNSYQSKYDSARFREVMEDFYAISEKGLGASVYSVRSPEIEDPSGTIFLAPYPHKANDVGGIIASSIQLPAASLGVNTPFGLKSIGLTGLHGPFQFNYLFSDGHVKKYFVQETCVDGKMNSYSDANKMWSRQEGD
jgi:prepilin-type processing-associated H-X9-DG protein